MKQDHKKCCYCGNFSAYYTRGYCCLLKENNGYCSRHQKIMEKDNSCAQWRCKRISRERRTRTVVNAIPEIYNKVAAIEQLLFEDAELKKLSDKFEN